MFNVKVFLRLYEPKSTLKPDLLTGCRQTPGGL
uniref:Uncharacterized protein n=1 Tax=Anguilla anguilla TaxID=7936 RepID=A0A0E9SS48_ANGAN